MLICGCLSGTGPRPTGERARTGVLDLAALPGQFASFVPPRGAACRPRGVAWHRLGPCPAWPGQRGACSPRMLAGQDVGKCPAGGYMRSTLAGNYWMTRFAFTEGAEWLAMVTRRRTPDYLPRDVLARPDFAEACAARKLGAMLRIALAWGGPGFSKNHLARRCQMTPSQVQDYMFRGRTALSLEIFERVADGLHIPGRMLGVGDRPWEAGNGDLLDERRSADWVLRTPWTVAGTLVSAREVSEVNPVDRRSFMFLTGTAVIAPAHDWLLARPVNDASGSGGRSIRPELVDDLDVMTGKLRGMDDEMGGGPLVDMVTAQAGYVARLLREGSYTDSVGRRLHATLAELLRLGGWVCYDGGDYPRAQRFWVAALHAAHTAGDSALGANVLSFMSVPALDLNRPDDAVKLAATALAGYKGRSPRVSAILHIHAARSHALIGDAADCKRAIDAAYDALRGSPAESGEPDWCYWMDEGAMNEHIGACFVSLNDYPSACDHLEMSLRVEENRRNSYFRDGVTRMIFLATAHAQHGEPERACAVGMRAIDALSGQVDSARLTGVMQGLRKNLELYQSVPAVREFSARVDELAGAGMPTQMPHRDYNELQQP